LRVDLAALMSELHERGVKRLMVEGGATLNWSLIQSRLVDELYVYVGGCSSEEKMRQHSWMGRAFGKLFCV